jgi:hypothetical protein
MSYLRYLCLLTHSGVQHILYCDFVLFFFVLCSLYCQLKQHQYWTERKIIIKTYKTTPILDRTENNDHDIQNNTISIQYGKYWCCFVCFDYYFPFCPILVLFCMFWLLFSVLSNIGVVLYVKIIIFRSVYWTERKIIIKTYKTTPILDRTENNNLNIQNNTNIGQNGK